MENFAFALVEIRIGKKIKFKLLERRTEENDKMLCKRNKIKIWIKGYRL